MHDCGSGGVDCDDVVYGLCVWCIEEYVELSAVRIVVVKCDA